MPLINTQQITNKMNLYPNVRIIFGEGWIERSILTFFNKRNKASIRNPYNSAIVNLEKQTHPLVRDIIRQINTNCNSFDLSDLPETKAFWELKLLERDLSLLIGDLSANKSVLMDYKNELILTKNYDQRRFELFVASNFKLCNFDVQFVPRASNSSLRTNEFNVMGKSKITYQVECKQRYQRQTDDPREKFLYLLTEKTFPILLNKKINNLQVTIEWSGCTNFSDVKELSTKIIDEASAGVYERKHITFGRYSIEITRFNQPLPRMLHDLQRDIPNYVTAIDSYIATDKGIFLLINRDFSQKTVKKIRTIYQDAKGQLSNSQNSLIYIDTGTMPTSVIDEIVAHFKINNPIDVGALILSKHQLHIDDDRRIIFSPHAQVIWNKKLFKSEQDVMQIPGSRGSSGFDEYIEELFPQ